MAVHNLAFSDRYYFSDLVVNCYLNTEDNYVYLICNTIPKSYLMGCSEIEDYCNSNNFELFGNSITHPTRSFHYRDMIKLFDGCVAKKMLCNLDICELCTLSIGRFCYYGVRLAVKELERFSSSYYKQVYFSSVVDLMRFYTHLGYYQRER